MSALGHKRTYAVQNVMSASPPKADMCSATRHVRFVPIADIVPLFDHLVGAREQGRRYLYPSCPGSSEIYHQLEFCRLLNRKSCRVCTFENSIDITRGASEEVHFIRPIGDKPAIRCVRQAR